MIIDSLKETAKRLLELAILEAKQNVSSNHPIQFGAAVMLEDESIITSHQSSALEYGCTLDAVSQLAPHLKDEASPPVMLVQADQYGIAHAPFAPARSFLTEHGFEDCLVLLHATPTLDNVRDNIDQWELKEVPAADLAPNAPAWTSTTSSTVDEEEIGDDNNKNETSKRLSLPKRDVKLPGREVSKSNADESKRPYETARLKDGNDNKNGLSSSIHEEHAQMVIGKLKPISKDLIDKWNASQGSFSGLSALVNDSAAGS